MPKAPALALAAVVLLLTGCPLVPPPADVPFPDDPRVLQGAWQVQVTGLAAQVSDLVYAPGSGRLMAWFDGEPRTFQFDETHGWEELDVGWPVAVTPDAYDPTIEAFVAVELARADPRIRVMPIDGGPTSVAAVTLPAGHTRVSVARGSGRAFALTRDAAGSHHLSWWDAASGAAGGTRPVGAVPDGMRASSNGRVLALWDVRGSRATLVDTADPDVVHALDAASRERAELARLADGGPLDGFDAWSRNLVVHRGTNLLAVTTANGMVHAAGLPGAAPPRPAARLPALDLTGAALDLTVVPIDASEAEGYEFHGTFTASGAGATGETWPLTGRVDAYGLHRYLPTAPSVAPAALPPLAAYVTASAIDPETGAELFALSLSTTDRNAAAFVGVLHDVVATNFFRVRVERAGHAEP